MIVATYVMRGLCVLIIGSALAVGTLYASVEIERARQRRRRRALRSHNSRTCTICQARSRARHARSGAERISQW